MLETSLFLFKILPMQLTSTMLHVLALSSQIDDHGVPEFLGKVSVWLFACLVYLVIHKCILRFESIFVMKYTTQCFKKNIISDWS